MNKTAQKAKICRYLAARKTGATRNEVEAMTGIRVQTLCRRLRELCDSGMIAGDEHRKCPVTKKDNIVYRATRQGKKWLGKK